MKAAIGYSWNHDLECYTWNQLTQIIVFAPYAGALEYNIIHRHGVYYCDAEIITFVA